jgi:hypothetical protein
VEILHHGAKSEAARRRQAATNRRLKARDLEALVVVEDGVVRDKTLLAVRKAAWALGARTRTLNVITRDKVVPVGVQRMILNPGKRSSEQRRIGKARIAEMRADRKRREREAQALHGSRARVIQLCLQAAGNYAGDPNAFHYLAGGKANTVFLEPTPLDWRSDCSQFASAVQHAAGLPDLGPNGPLWVSTYVMSQHLDSVAHPTPGDFGMYGTRNNPHHVEVYLGRAGGAGHEFVGHGSPPINSLTPGRPDFYLKNPIGS